MLKQYFTDGLIQIAIVLSLLRTDLNNYLNINYVNYPEVQEIIQGQSVAYTQTNFHHSFYRPYSTHLGSPEIYRKNIEVDYLSVYRDLRTLRPQPTLNDDIVPTFLLIGGQAPNIYASESTTNTHAANETEDENNNNIENSNSNAPTIEDLEVEGQNLLNTLEESLGLGAIGPLVENLQGTDPTHEDLDLIEVLWRQDIDLGVGKEVFDPNLRRELEREREIELQKERQKQKEQEQLQAKLEEQRRNAQQRWLHDNFTQDGETGEWVPLGGTRVPPPPPAPDLSTMPQQVVEQFMPNYDAFPMMGDGLPQEANNNYNGIPNHPPPQYPSQPTMQHQPQQGMYNMNVGQYNGVVNNGSNTNGSYQQPPAQRPCTLPQGFHQQSPQAQGQYNNTGNFTHHSHNFSHVQNVSQHQQIQVQQQQQQQRNRVDNGYPRQSSLEATWQDLVNLLDLPLANQSSQQNATMSSNGPVPSSNGHSNMTVAPMTPQHQQNMTHTLPSPTVPSHSMNSTMPTQHNNSNNNNMNNSLPSHSMSPMVDTSSMLIQNASMPTPAPMRGDNVTFNNSGMVSQCHRSPPHSSGMLSPCAENFNSSMPSGRGLGPLEWESCGDLFPNITASDPSLDDVDELLPDLIAEDELEDINFGDMELNDGGMTPTPGRAQGDDASSDSAVSMGSQSVGSPDQSDLSDGAMSPFDGLEGATGGHDGATFPKTSKYDPDDFKYGNSCSYSSGGDSNCSSNFSSNSNDTGCGGHFGGGHGGYSPASNGHINHNHTYPLKPGQEPKDFKKNMFNNNNNKEGRHKGPQSKDHKRIEELKIPYSVDQIVNTPVEEFNEMLTRCKFSDQQLQLIRDIRRRGKNKVAAQNCRKRKIGVLEHLEDEMTTLERMRDKLMQERHLMDKQTREMKEKLGLMYSEIFHSLRDEHGRPYDPSRFSLQQSSDGDVFLVPRNYTTEEDMNKKKKHEK